jgi:hypothetical protein
MTATTTSSASTASRTLSGTPVHVATTRLLDVVRIITAWKQ